MENNNNLTTRNGQPQEAVVVEEEKGISLRDILHVIHKHWIVMLALLAVGTAGGFAAGKITNKISPKYTASATMMVTVSSENLGTGTATAQYQLSNYLTTTFVEFVKEKEVIDQVSAIYNIKTATIQKNLSVSLKNDSLILSVSYTDADKERSVKITNDVIKYTIVTADSLKEEGLEDKKDNANYPLLYKNISSLTPADESGVSVASNTMKYTLIGAAAGLVAAVVYAVVREMFDNSFKNNNDIERELGLPVLADIPVYEFKDEQKDSSKKGGK